MLDLEKVIKGLECCLANGHNNCPYKSTDEGIDKVTTCTTYLMRDALALLKEREPIAPIEHYIPDEAHRRRSLAWECGNCLIDIGYGVNYCYNCGRAVKWDG